MEATKVYLAWLGLSADAERAEIDDALQRVEWRAAMLADQSPDRARALQARVAQVRRELLGETPAPQPDPFPGVLGEQWSMRVGPTPARPVAAKHTTRRPVWIAGALDTAVAATVMAALALALLHPWSGEVRAPTPPVAAAVPLAGSGHPYPSGQSVTLRWSRVPHATIYYLDLAETSTLAAPDTVLDVQGRTILTRATHLTLRVVGQQFYYWRVQGYIGSMATRRSSAQIFAVDRPHAAAPTLLQQRRVVRPGRVRLCWVAQPATSGYTVRLDSRSHTTSRHCLSASLAVGRHQWSVAALVRGTHLYRGSFSPVATLVARWSKRVVHRRRVIRRRVIRRRVQVIARSVPVISVARPSMPAPVAVVRTPVTVSSLRPAASAPVVSRPVVSQPVVVAPTPVAIGRPSSAATIKKQFPSWPGNTITYGRVHRASSPPVTDGGSSSAVPAPPPPPAAPITVPTAGVIPAPPPPPPVP